MKVIPPHLVDHDCPEHLRITRMFIIRAQQENDFGAIMEEKRDYKELKKQIKELYASGVPVTEISSIISMSPSSIYRFLAKE